MDAYAGRVAHRAPDRRTVAEIQREIVKRGNRNTISRLFPANDKEAIATWRSNLNRVLHVFDVCSVTFVWLLPMFPFQTELGIKAHVTTSDMPHDIANAYTIGSAVHRDIPNADATTPDVLYDVSKTRAIISGVRNGVGDARTTDSDVNRNTLKSRGHTDGKNRAVSASRTLSITE